MKAWFKFFVEELHPIFLDALNKEYLQLREKKPTSSFAHAMKNTTERLIENDPKFQGLKSQLSNNDLTQILRVTLRIAYYSIGVKACSNIIKENQDPVIQLYCSSIYHHPGELKKIEGFLIEKWSQAVELEKIGITFTFADKMDLLLALVVNAGKMYDFKNLSKFEAEISQLISKSSENQLTNFYKSLFYTTLSFWLREKGDFNQTIKLNDLAINYAKELKHPYLLGYAANTNGAILVLKGDFSGAIQQFSKSLEYLKTIGDIQGMAYAFNNIGVIQSIRGYFTTARESFLKSKELHLQSTGQIFRTVTYSNIASTYRAEGNFVEALKVIQEGLQIEQQNKQATLDLLNLLIEQIEIYLDNKDIINAGATLQKLKKVIHALNSRAFESLEHYYTGILEANETNFGLAKRELIKAIEFSSTSSDAYRIMLKAEIQLANVLLSSYRFSRKSEEFNQAFTLIENTIQACREQELLPLLCDVLIIRAYLYSIQNNLEKSKEDLMVAIEIAERLGLVQQITRSKEYFELLKTRVNLTPIEKTDALLDFLETSGRSILSFQLFGNPKPIESKLYGILFSTESGVPIYAKYFDERLMKDDILLSGLLSGISSFTKELFSKSNHGSLRSIIHEDITILIERVKVKLLVSFFVDKDTHDIRTKLSQIAREIEDKITGVNLHYDQSYVEKTPLLEKIFIESINKVYPNIES